MILKRCAFRLDTGFLRGFFHSIIDLKRQRQQRNVKKILQSRV